MRGPNPANLLNGATFGTGSVAQAFVLNASGAAAQASTQGFPTGSADRTLEGWARLDGTPAMEAFFFGYGVPGVNGSMYILGTSGTRYRRAR